MPDSGGPSRPRSRRSSSPVAERLLGAAERLLLRDGLAVSVRDITDAAGANVAAIHYYFGSRDGLLAAVLERHWQDLAKRRRQALDAMEQMPEPPTARVVIGALVDTFVDFVASEGDDGQRWLDLMSTLWIQRSPALSFVSAAFTELDWQDLLLQALPDLPKAVFEARLTLAVDLVVAAVRTPVPSETIPTYPLPADLSSRAELIVDFVAAGLEAPVGPPPG